MTDSPTPELSFEILASETALPDAEREQIMA